MNYHSSIQAITYMKVAVIIQARMGSSRLPGKVLMPFLRKPCLTHIVERCGRANMVDEIIITVTDDPMDKDLIKYCEQMRYFYYIGKGTDVLTQVLETAEYYKVDVIVEITADCPLVDPFHIDILVEKLHKKRKLYSSNVFPRTMIDGFDVQVYRTETLQIIDNLVTIPEHRRHVGWNIMTRMTTDDIFSLTTMDSRSNPKTRLTLDTAEDYKAISMIFEAFGHNRFSFLDVLDYIHYHPEVLEINKNIKSKQPGQDG